MLAQWKKEWMIFLHICPILELFNFNIPTCQLSDIWNLAPESNICLKCCFILIFNNIQLFPCSYYLFHKFLAVYSQFKYQLWGWQPSSVHLSDVAVHSKLDPIPWFYGLSESFTVLELSPLEVPQMGQWLAVY